MQEPQQLPISIWIEHTPLHQFMVDNPIAFTFCETLHFMGLTVLCGTLLVVDLRGLGFFRKMPLLELHKLVPFAIGAFVVQLLTGICFIASSANHYFVDLAFQVKMFLVMVAGINALVFEFCVFRPMEHGDASVEFKPVTKITSALSILCWTGVLIGGRLIPYV